MVFKARRHNNGELDENINLNGRVDGKKAAPLTNKEVRNRELISLLRKLKPHLSESIKTAVNIMQSKDSTDMNKLKAATIILAEYKSNLESVYNERYDEAEAEEVQPANKATIFSLTMVKNDKEVAQS